MKRAMLALGVLAGLLGAGGAHALLIDRGRGLIYDTDRDITWVQDANLCVTLGNCLNSVSGEMTWSDANAWANALVYGGYDDWRLPSALNEDGTGPCFFYYCTSEMGHLYYSELGGIPGQDLSFRTGSHGPFPNIQFAYWSNTEGDPGFAWFFAFDSGSQYIRTLDVQWSAWAVRPGDSPVPEPETLALFTTGLFGLGGLRRLLWRRR